MPKRKLTPAQKEMQRIYMLAYRERNRESLAAQNKAAKAKHYAANREFIRQQRRQHYAANTEEMRAKDQKHRAANRERVCAMSCASQKRRWVKVAVQQKAWRDSHKAEQRQYKRRQYLANADKFKARAMAYGKSHPGYRAAIARKRAAVKLGCPVDELKRVAAFYLAVQSATIVFCHWCKKEILKGKERTVDHVTPIALGGGHVLANLVPACRSCNCRKQKMPPAEFIACLKTA